MEKKNGKRFKFEMFAIGDEKKNDNGSDSAVQSFTS